MSLKLSPIWLLTYKTMDSTRTQSKQIDFFSLFLAFSFRWDLNLDLIGIVIVSLSSVTWILWIWHYKLWFSFMSPFSHNRSIGVSYSLKFFHIIRYICVKFDKDSFQCFKGNICYWNTLCIHRCTLIHFDE